MSIPKFFLVSSKLADEQLEKVREAIAFTPIDVALVSRPQDVDTAKKLTEHVTGLHRPIAIVADFKEPFSTISEDGNVTSVSLD